MLAWGWVVAGFPHINRPLPNRAAHVVEAVGVRGEGACGGGGRGVRFLIVPGESAVPVVGHAVAVGGEQVAPGVCCSFQAASGCVLPLGFCGELFACPSCVCLCVVVINMHYGMMVKPCDSAVWAVGVSPVGTGHILPPSRMVKIHRPLWCHEHRRACHQSLGGHIRVVLFGWLQLGTGCVAGLFNEDSELGVGDWADVHPEPFHFRLVGGAFFRVVVV